MAACLHVAQSQRLRAAVKAGLAITAILQEDLEPGIVEINADAGLPPLSQASFRLLWSASGDARRAGMAGS